MMNLFENYLQKRDYSYLTMSGSTAIGNRQKLINQFNTVSMRTKKMIGTFG